MYNFSQIFYIIFVYFSCGSADVCVSQVCLKSKSDFANCWVLGSNRRSKTRSLSAQIRRLQPFEKCHKSQAKSAKRNLCVGYQNTKMVSSLNCNKLTGSPLVCAADGRITLVGIAKGRVDCESKVVLETHATVSNNMQWITKTVEENN